MALKIGLSSYVSAGFVNPVIWRLKEDVSGVLIDDHQEMGPHGVVYNFDFSDNIRDIAYRIEFYDQPGGVGIGNLIKSHVVTPSTQTLTFDSDIELVVDGGETYDPVGGASSVIIPQLLGKDYYVMQRGIGQLLATRNIEVTDDTVNGGFALTDGTFNADDIFVVKIRPQYVVNPPGSQAASSIYKAVELVTADRVLTSVDFGKLLIVEGVAAVITIELPLIATIIEKVSLFIRSMGATHINVIIKAATGETITATGAISQTMILGRAEEAEIINLGGVLYGFSDSQDIKRAGQLDWAYTVGLNRLWADGTEYNCADYPRIKKAMDALQVGQVLTYVQWASTVLIDGVAKEVYKGFFALSGDGTKFKVPDLRNRSIRALRYSDNTVDADRYGTKGGGYQHDQNKAHGHRVNTGGGAGSANPGRSLVRQSYNGDTYGAEGTGTSSWGPYIEVVGGTEVRNINIGLVPQIIS